MASTGIQPSFFSQALEGMDPLSALLGESGTDNEEHTRSSTDQKQKWNDLVLSVSSKFRLPSEVTEQKSLKDKIASRIAQLDRIEMGVKDDISTAPGVVTAEEFHTYMNKLKVETTSLWKADQRVATLNVAIRAVLNLTQRLPSLPYPVVFGSVCDIIDYFGDLVYDRIVSKGGITSANVASSKLLIPQESAETAKNWLSKLVQIPDLVCRTYLEVAVIRIHRFSHLEKIDETLRRLGNVTRDIRDPVIATYLRTYLLQAVNLHYENQAKTSWYEGLWHDTLLNVSEGMKELVALPEYDRLQNSLAAGLELFFFGMDRGLGARFWTVTTARQCVSSSQCGLFLHAFIKAMPVAYFNEHAAFLTEALLGVKGFPLDKIYVALGSKLGHSGAPKTQRRKVLSQAWKGISQSPDLGKFLTMSEAWLGYVIRYHNSKDLDVIVGEMIAGTKSRLTAAGRPMSPLESNTLLAVLSRMLNDTQAFSTLLSLDHFLPFLEIFPKPHARFSASKECLYKVLAQKGDIPLFYLLPTLEICRTAYVSLTAVSAEDDRRQVTNLVCGVIGKISTHWDVDAQLDLYVDLRRDFPDLDDVLALLVERSCQLSRETFSRKATSSRQLVDSFFSTCSAFTFITIPSIQSPKKRLQLYILSGRTSLEVGCLGLAEASFGEAVKLFMTPDVLKRDMREKEWTKELLKLAESVVALPDHPDRGPLFLLRSLSAAQRQYSWQSSELRCKWLSHIFPLICRLEFMEDGIPDHFRLLYAGNVDFQRVVKDEKALVLEDISQELVKLENAGADKAQADFAATLGRSLLQPCLSADQPAMKLLHYLVKLLVKQQYTKVASEIVTGARQILESEPSCQRYLGKLEGLLA